MKKLAIFSLVLVFGLGLCLGKVGALPSYNPSDPSLPPSEDPSPYWVPGDPDPVPSEPPNPGGFDLDLDDLLEPPPLPPPDLGDPNIPSPPDTLPVPDDTITPPGPLPPTPIEDPSGSSEDSDLSEEPSPWDDSSSASFCCSICGACFETTEDLEGHSIFCGLPPAPSDTDPSDDNYCPNCWTYLGDMSEADAVAHLATCGIPEEPSSPSP